MAARRAGSRARQRRRDERLLARDEKQGRDQPAHAVTEEQARRIAMVAIAQSPEFGHAVEKGRKARELIPLATRRDMTPLIAVIDRIDALPWRLRDLGIIQRMVGVKRENS